MQLFRITRSIYARDQNGTGGLYEPGRWHNRGTLILYTSEHVSLVKLEVLANSTETPINVSLITLEIPNEVSILSISAADLPIGWNRLPYHPALAKRTIDWITEQKHWIMRVPSVHSPTEFNYLLNPLHPQHHSLKIVSIEPHPFDPRLK
jgi:RES domain-containing protein